MLTVALTGGIGSGKTTVCELFSELGTPVIDTDLIARELVLPGQEALNEISSYFGKDILNSDGSLDRKALARKTFGDPKDRSQLESILHPRIRNRVKSTISTLDAPYVIIAIPLLIETSQQTTYDRVLVVDCEEQQQIQRTQSRDRRSIEEINNIMAAQANRQQRLEHTDDIIENKYDIQSLRNQVKKLHELYIKLSSSNNL